MGGACHSSAIVRYALRFMFCALYAWLSNLAEPALAQDEVTLTLEKAISPRVEEQ